MVVDMGLYVFNDHASLRTLRLCEILPCRLVVLLP